MQRVCHHAHCFEVPDERAGLGQVRCPLCGSVATFPCSGSTAGKKAGQDTLEYFSIEGQLATQECRDTAPASQDLRARDRDRAVQEEPSTQVRRAAESLAPHSGAAPETRVTRGIRAVTMQGLESAETPGAGASSAVMATTGGGHPAESRSESEPRPVLERYEIIRELGRGGMGVVYLAFDRVHQREVALKTLQRISPVGLRRFKYESRSLAHIAHENLASLYELSSEGRIWFFTMEYLHGVSFLEYVWSGFQKLDLAANAAVPLADISERGLRLTADRKQRLLSGLKQLALGLHALHSAGKLHRDIKPSNVMVTTEGRLALLDFGLVAELESGALRSDGGLIQGTPSYMAPEQAAAAPMSPASDWYAVGVMLYEVLTGELPFQGPSRELLAAKQRQLPVEPRQRDATVPAELNELCLDLLAIKPEERPTDLEVLLRLGFAELATSLAEEQRSLAGRTLDLVGRERHLQTLHEAFQSLQEGQPLSVFVQGRSGMGKSVLIRRFLDELQHRPERQEEAAGRRPPPPVILEGRCYAQESVPFKALDSLIDALSLHLNALPKAQVRKLLPRDTRALMRVFPVLGQFASLADAETISLAFTEQQELRQRALLALRELLTNLGRRNPLVLYIDDLQWGDLDSAALLADLVRPPDPPRLLLLGAFRGEDLATSPCLQTLQEAYARGHVRPAKQTVTVEPLDDEEVKRLALALVDCYDEAAVRQADAIVREAQGCPFFVWELARHAHDQDASAGGALDLDQVIWRRAEKLPEEMRRLLELVAVAGRPMPADDMYRALGETSQGPRLLSHLRTSNFVRSVGGDKAATIEPYHDRIRESVVAHLAPVRIQDYSLRLALEIERSSGVDLQRLQAHLRSTPDFAEPREPYALSKQEWQPVFDLAKLFAAGGAADRALPYALAAAEQARSQHALEVAEEFYRLAFQGVAKDNPGCLCRIQEGLGEVLMVRGKYAAAEGPFKAARELAQGAANVARLEGKLGELAFRQGDMRRAADHLEHALAVLGRRPPRRQWWLYLLVAKEGVRQVLHTLRPQWCVGQRSLEHVGYDLISVRLYNRLVYAYWFSRGLAATLWAHLRQLNLAERYPPTLELAQAYSMHAPIMSTIPLYQRGIRYAETSFKIRQSQRDLWGQGQSLHFHGVVLFAASQFEECIEKCRAGIRMLEQAGDAWEANMARYHVADSLYHLGRLDEAREEAQRVYSLGLETGDVQSVGVIMFVLALASPGQIPVQEIESERQRPRQDPLATLQVAQAHGLRRLLHDREPSAAAEIFRDNIRQAKLRGLQNTYVMSNRAWLATALRWEAERQPLASARRAALLKQARQAARQSLRGARKFQNDLAHALRENAILATLSGDSPRARQLFDEALRVAQRQHAEYEAAQTELARAQAGLQFGWPGAQEQLAAAQHRLAAFETPDAEHRSRHR